MEGGASIINNHGMIVS